MPTRRAFSVLGLLLLLAAGTAAADTLEDVKRDGKLLWGGDQEGGGPYIFPRDDDPEQITGFEVELADAIAKYLEVEAEAFQGPWDKMPDLLRAQRIHIVLNGYEWTPVRADTMESSIPYFAYGLRFLVRADDASLQGPDDLKKPRADGAKRKVGALTGSAAEEYLRDHCGDACEVISYDGNTDAMREVETGKLDGTLQDTPIAAFYGPRFPKLKPVGEPVAPGYYVIYARKGDRALIEKINEALILLIRNGGLERIYRKYGIWDDKQGELAKIADNGRFFGFAGAVTAEVKPTEMPASEELGVGQRKTGWIVVSEYFGTLLRASGVTIILAAVAFPLAIILGLLVAVGRLYGPGWLRPILTAYVEFLRGTPLMLQLYFIFFLLPEAGINVPAFTTAVLGLAINYSAYESEIYRAGLQAIPLGQMEAALSLGMSRTLALRRIVVPQAVRMVIPPVVNDFIALFKDTSVCSVVTVVELTKRFSVLSLSTQAVVEMMTMTALLYLLMSYPLSLLARKVEERLGGGGTR